MFLITVMVSGNLPRSASSSRVEQVVATSDEINAL
jgi:hypothetical protein